jgi:hypothetical protein
MKKFLWLDDIRNPNLYMWQIQYMPNYNEDSDSIIWVKDYNEFVSWINQNGLPNEIFFDHDLGKDESGYDVAKWLVDYCIDNNLDLPKWKIQSANPVGRDNINGLLNNYNKFRK